MLAGAHGRKAHADSQALWKVVNLQGGLVAQSECQGGTLQTVCTRGGVNTCISLTVMAITSSRTLRQLRLRSNRRRLRASASSVPRAAESAPAIVAASGSGKNKPATYLSNECKERFVGCYCELWHKGYTLPLKQQSTKL